MAGFEDLIRGTLSKHGDVTPEARAAIYDSSRQALERMLSQNQALDLAAQSLQRQRLESAIANIEVGYLANSNPTQAAASQSPWPVAPSPVAPVGAAPIPAAPPPPTTPLQPPQSLSPPTASTSPSPPPPPPPIPVFRPDHSATPAGTDIAPSNPGGIRVEPGTESPPLPVPPTAPVAAPASPPSPSFPSPPSPPPPPPIPVKLGDGKAEVAESVEESAIDSRDAYSEAYAASAARERKPYAKLLLWTIIVVGFGVASWWAYTFGPALIEQQLGGSVPNPGQTIESGQFLPGDADGWITVFNPSDDSINIDAGGRGTAEVFQNPNERFVRLASNAGNSENNLKILVPRGVMLPLKGEAATVEILLKSSAKTNHQFAVYCEFGKMGNCGRKRFTAGDRVEAQIFDVILNNVELGQDEDAYLSFNTDVGGNGRAVDIYVIRLRPN